MICSSCGHKTISRWSAQGLAIKQQEKSAQGVAIKQQGLWSSKGVAIKQQVNFLQMVCL